MDKRLVEPIGKWLIWYATAVTNSVESRATLVCGRYIIERKLGEVGWVKLWRNPTATI